jgi:hypothetical protein
MARQFMLQSLNKLSPRAYLSSFQKTTANNTLSIYNFNYVCLKNQGYYGPLNLTFSIFFI